ncbi:MAG TPA: 50S ribosomal protein L24e [Candidatus Nanoarchaeia archaeon]|nr:50S ribosomal protein L24e [Candidatus Nanoarchaeia archaeon]
MVKCTFCGENIKPGTGMMYVKSDATIMYFCGSKCEKNTLKLKRKAHLVKWSGRYKK